MDDLIRPSSVLSVSLSVNGQPMTCDVPADMRLVSFLRDQLGLTGTKVGCEVGVCGVCTVLLDGLPSSSCLTLVAQADGKDVLTIEGIAEREDFQKLLDAFIAEGGFQCGFCTSGQIMTIAALMLSPDGVAMNTAELRQYLAGNLCRCTGYYGIEHAARRVLG